MKVIRILLVLIILILMVAVGYLYFTRPTLEAVDSSDTTEVLVQVEEGSTPSQFFDELQTQDLIRSSIAAQNYFKEQGYSLYAGYFKISRSMSADEIADHVSNIANLQLGNVLTIVEGAQLTDIAQELANVSDLNYEYIISYWSNQENLQTYINKYDFISDEILNPDIKYPLEGYFTPATYPIDENASIDEITTTMLDHSGEIFSQFLTKSAPQDMTFHEALTLASIVERETINDDDKPIVAGVFLNRIANTDEYGKLQSDITVLYALGEHKEQVLYSDLEVDDPYNTYLYDGLVPGPIASPSLASLHAVYDPDKNDYYFFYADTEGKIYYSETYEEHNEIIDQFR